MLCCVGFASLGFGFFFRGFLCRQGFGLGRDWNGYLARY